MRGKRKKFVIGIILAAVGVVGLFGMFGNTEDKVALLCGSLVLIAAGVVLVVIDKKFPDKLKSASTVPASSVTSKKQTFTFIIAGVTFNNGRKTRQAILRKIKWGDEPFDGKVRYTLKEYDFEGSSAVGVYANGEQIDNVPKDSLAFVLSCIDSISNISVNVYGGGQNDGGENIYFGAEATITID